MILCIFQRFSILAPGFWILIQKKNTATRGLDASLARLSSQLPGIEATDANAQEFEMPPQFWKRLMDFSSRTVIQPAEVIMDLAWVDVIRIADFMSKCGVHTKLLKVHGDVHPTKCLCSFSKIGNTENGIGTKSNQIRVYKAGGFILGFVMPKHQFLGSKNSPLDARKIDKNDRSNGIDQIFRRSEMKTWLVVEPPLWKIWFRQLGWLSPIWMEK